MNEAIQQPMAKIADTYFYRHAFWGLHEQSSICETQQAQQAKCSPS